MLCFPSGYTFSSIHQKYAKQILFLHLFSLVLHCQILTLLEGAVKSDYLSSNFESSRELIGSGDLITDYDADNIPNLEMIAVPPWIPKTTAAVALRIMEFDASICYTLHQNEDFKRERESRNIIVSIMGDMLCYFLGLEICFFTTYSYTVISSLPQTIPVRNTASKNGREYLLHEEDAYDASGKMHNSWGRGRSKGRGRNGIQDGGRSSQRSITESTSKKNDKFGPLSGWKGRQRISGGGHKRGRRTARNRQKSTKKVAKITSVHATRANTNNSYNKMPGSSHHQLEWNEEEQVQVEGNVSSSGRSGFDDDDDDDNDDYNGEATTGYVDHQQIVSNYSRVLGRKPRHLSDDFIYDMSEEDGNDEIEEEEEENGGDGAGDGSEDEGEGEVEAEEEEEEYIDSDEEGNKFIGKEEMPNLNNKGLGFSSSDYSD